MWRGEYPDGRLEYQMCRGKAHAKEVFSPLGVSIYYRYDQHYRYQCWRGIFLGEKGEYYRSFRCHDEIDAKRSAEACAEIFELKVIEYHQIDPADEHKLDSTRVRLDMSPEYLSGQEGGYRYRQDFLERYYADPSILEKPMRIFDLYDLGW